MNPFLFQKPEVEKVNSKNTLIIRILKELLG